MNNRHQVLVLVLLAVASSFPAMAQVVEAEPREAAWQSVFSDGGRRMEVDRSSIKKDPDGKVQAWGRMIFERPVPDATSGSAFRVLEALNRYDCKLRTFATLKRVYRKDEKTPLREEDSKSKVELPVRTGTLDDKMLKVACKPTGNELMKVFNTTVDMAKEVAAEPPRKELMRTDLAGSQPTKPRPTSVQKAEVSSKPAAASPKRLASLAKATSAQEAIPTKRIEWSYEGEGGPENWGQLKPDYATCAAGQRQSPIDISDGIRVDLPPIDFKYKPAQFRIIDNTHTVQVTVADNRITLMGKDYELKHFHFHKPSGERVAGKNYEMAVHLVHRSDDNKYAVLAIFLEKGVEHPLIQTLWNYLPLEKNVDVYPPNIPIDLNQLLPEKKDYYTYMGSFDTPPCSEGVLWLVLKNPVQVSPEQVAIFGRIHPANARPVQADNGRLIKESR